MERIAIHLAVRDHLGKGGTANVYVAENERLNKKYAIKIWLPHLAEDPQFRQRLEESARTLARIGDHPNIVQVHDYAQSGDDTYVVLDYVDGEALDKIIHEQGKLQEDHALSIIEQILEGLNFAHQKTVFHRDVKPSNVLIDKLGRARITDFDIARKYGNRGLTRTGTLLGTVAYMSPEQIQHPTEIDHRADMYSAAVVLYEMLTGEVPFRGDTDSEVLLQQIQVEPPDPRTINADVTPALARIILKALEKDREKRYRGCGEFLAAIRAYKEDKRIPRQIPVERRTSRSLWIAAGAIAIAVIGFLIGTSKNADNSAPPPVPTVDTSTPVACPPQTPPSPCPQCPALPVASCMSKDAAADLIVAAAQTHDWLCRAYRTEFESPMFADELRSGYSMQYQKYVAALAKADRQTVAGAFARTGAQANIEADYGKWTVKVTKRYRDWVQADYGQQRSQQKQPSMTELKNRCG